jgi:flavodoxin
MKTILIYTSVHHQNTEKVAAAIAEELNATMIKTEDATPGILNDYDLIGFGSGIYFWKHHKILLSFVKDLPSQQGKRAFLFSTSGQGGTAHHAALRDAVLERGFTVLDEWACKGWDTYGLIKLIGGINKGRPNEEDVRQAKEFARHLKEIRG